MKLPSYTLVRHTAVWHVMHTWIRQSKKAEHRLGEIDESSGMQMQDRVVLDILEDMFLSIICGRIGVNVCTS